MRKVHEARLVMFGEVHAEDGPIRDAQKEALLAFVNTPAFEALGFEPSVELAQGQIIELAKSLGMRTISLEPNWRELSSEYRIGARDIEAASTINEFLGLDPAHRMFVIRGESHVTPGGFLARRLNQAPLILLSGVLPVVPLCVGGMHCNGTTWTLDHNANVYVLPCFDEIDWPGLAELESWLAAH